MTYETWGWGVSVSGWPGLAESWFTTTPATVRQDQRGTKYVEAKRLGGTVRRSEGALDALLALRAEGSAGLEKFVRAWGALPVCKHGEVLYHRVRNMRGSLHGQVCRDLLTRQPWEKYQTAANYYAAIIETGDALWDNRVGRIEAWETFLGPPVRFRVIGSPVKLGPPTLRRALSIMRIRHEATIRSILDQATVRVSIKWDKGGANLLFEGADLWAALAQGVLFRVLNPSRLLMCKNCLRPVKPGRGRRPNQDQWCGEVECRRARNREKANRFREVHAG